MNRYHFTFLLALLPLMGLISLGCPSNNSTSPSAPTSTPTAPYSLGISFGLSSSITMNGPEGVAISGATLWVTNQGNSGNGNNSLQAWSTTGGAITQIITFNTSDNFSRPYGLAIGPDGYVYVGDSGHNRIVEFDPLGAYVTVFGSAQLGTDTSYGVAVDSTYVFVTDEIINGVIRFTIAGSGNSKTFGSPITFSANGVPNAYTSDITLDTSGNPYVLLPQDQEVVKYTSAGVSQMAVTQGIAAAGGVAVDGTGNLFVAQIGPGIIPTPSVNQYSPSGGLLNSYANGLLSNPGHLALDASGNLYVADGSHNQIVVLKRN